MKCKNIPHEIDISICTLHKQVIQAPNANKNIVRVRREKDNIHTYI